MFDLRYHVASLAAVFVALIVGILIGVGLSGRGFVSDSERQLLEARITDLQERASAAESRVTTLSASQKAASAFIERAYPAVVGGRLEGKRIAVVFVGSADAGLRTEVQTALTDGGAPGIARLRALRVPLAARKLATIIAARPALAGYRGTGGLADLGRDFGTQLALGGRSTLIELLAPTLLEERVGNDRKPIDGVVVVRSVGPQSGATATFLTGLYAGLVRAGVPTVGVGEKGDASPAIKPFAAAGMSTVDDIDDRTGRAALVLLLAGAERGAYGVAATARDGIVPVLPAAAPVANGG